MSYHVIKNVRMGEYSVLLHYKHGYWLTILPKGYDQFLSGTQKDAEDIFDKIVEALDAVK